MSRSNADLDQCFLVLFWEAAHQLSSFDTYQGRCVCSCSLFLHKMAITARCWMVCSLEKEDFLEHLFPLTGTSLCSEGREGYQRGPARLLSLLTQPLGSGPVVFRYFHLPIAHSRKGLHYLFCFQIKRQG